MLLILTKIHYTRSVVFFLKTKISIEYTSINKENGWSKGKENNSSLKVYLFSLKIKQLNHHVEILILLGKLSHIITLLDIFTGQFINKFRIFYLNGT